MVLEIPRQRLSQMRTLQKVIFLDCDTLVLRNIDHLLEGDWDVAYQPEKGSRITTSQFSCFLTDEERATMNEPGVNSGTIAVRSILNAYS